MKLLVILFLLVSCSSNQKNKSEEKPSLNKKKAMEPLKKRAVQSHDIKPGELFFIDFDDLREKGKGDLYCKGKKVPYFRGKKSLQAFVVETYFSKHKPFSCEFKTPKKSYKITRVKIKEKEFPSEKLNVDKKKIFPPKKALKRIRREQKFLNKNYASSPAYPLFERAFKLPINSKVTSIYGSRRLYNNKKQSQHLGTDYRAAIGTPIFAANSGKVVVSRDLYYTGNTVTLDHGLSIFTVYGHLSKVNVIEGDYVPKGSLIGWAGMTGRVTGPHLHWGVKVQGEWIEGDSLIKATHKMGN